MRTETNPKQTCDRCKRAVPVEEIRPVLGRFLCIDCVQDVRD